MLSCVINSTSLCLYRCRCELSPPHSNTHGFGLPTLLQRVHVDGLIYILFNYSVVLILKTYLMLVLNKLFCQCTRELITNIQLFQRASTLHRQSNMTGFRLFACSNSIGHWPMHMRTLDLLIRFQILNSQRKTGCRHHFLQ